MREYACDPKSFEVDDAFRLMVQAELGPEIQEMLKGIGNKPIQRLWVVMVGAENELPRLVVRDCGGRFEAQRSAEVLQEAFDRERGRDLVVYWAAPVFG